jgi:hypothetical protein
LRPGECHDGDSDARHPNENDNGTFNKHFYIDTILLDKIPNNECRAQAYTQRQMKPCPPLRIDLRYFESHNISSSNASAHSFLISRAE